MPNENPPNSNVADSCQTSINTGAFIIPKKAKKEEQRSSPDQLFYEMSVTEGAFQTDIALPFFDNLLISALRSAARLSNAKRIHNEELVQKFSSRHAQLKRRGSPTEVCYAFLQLDANDEVEEQYISSNGFYTGYTVYDELGPSELGVTLSLHPDCCSPAAFFDRSRLKILICKVLKGRSKFVPVKLGGVESRVDPNFNSYLPQQYRGADLSGESPLQRFRYSQVFMYEHTERHEVCDVLTGILPWATVNVSFALPGPSIRCLSLPTYGENVVWSGVLKFDENCVDNVEMLSIFKEALKPTGFVNTLEVEGLVPWSECLYYPPLTELLSVVDLCGALVENHCVEVKVRESSTIQHFNATYFTLREQISPAFRSIHNTLRRGQLAGLSVLPDGTIFFLIPNGELSSLLALPNNFNFPIFHCLFFATGIKVDEEYGFNPSIGEVTATNFSYKMPEPSDLEIIDSRAQILAAVAEFNAEWANENTNGVDRDFNHNSSTHSEQQYSPQLGNSHSTLHNITGQQLPPPPPQQSSSSSCIEPKNAVAVLSAAMVQNSPTMFTGPFLIPPPPLPTAATTSSLPDLVKDNNANGVDVAKTNLLFVDDSSHTQTMVGNVEAARNSLGDNAASDIASNNEENRRKNRALVQQTMKSVINIGKQEMGRESTNFSTDSPASPSPASPRDDIPPVTNNLNSLPQNVLRDPRLKRVVATDPGNVQKIFGVELPPRLDRSISPNSIALDSPASPTVMPYSPTQMAQSMSPVPMDICSDSESPSPKTPTPNVIKLREPKTSPGASPLSKDIRPSALDHDTTPSTSVLLRDMSSIMDDSAMPRFMGGFATSTPKVADTEKKSGLNFDFLNWNKRSTKKAGENDRNVVIPNKIHQPQVVKSAELKYLKSEPVEEEAEETLFSVIPKPRERRDDKDDDDDSPQLCIADIADEDSMEERPTSATAVHKHKPTSLPDEPLAKECPASLTAPNSSNGAAAAVVAIGEENGNGGGSGRLSPSCFKVELPPPGIVHNPVVAAEKGLVKRFSRPRPALLPFPPAGTTQPFISVPPPMTSLIPIPPSPLSKPPPIPPPSVFLPLPISKAPPLTSIAPPLPVPPQHVSFFFPRPASIPASTNLLASPTASNSSGVQPSNIFEDTKEGAAITIIPDPDLILDFAINVKDFLTILELGKRYKEKYSNRRLSIKFHQCITKDLIALRKVSSAPSSSINNASNRVQREEIASRCGRFIDLIEEHVQLGLIEYMREHVCDLPPRNANKYMICCMNVIRQVPPRSGIIFMSQAVVNNQSEVSKNFTNNGIKLRLPKEIIAEMQAAEANLL